LHSGLLLTRSNAKGPQRNSIEAYRRLRKVLLLQLVRQTHYAHQTVNQSVLYIGTLCGCYGATTAGDANNILQYY